MAPEILTLVQPPLTRGSTARFFLLRPSCDERIQDDAARPADWRSYQLSLIQLWSGT